MRSKVVNEIMYSLCRVVEMKLSNEKGPRENNEQNDQDVKCNGSYVTRIAPIVCSLPPHTMPAVEQSVGIIFLLDL